MNITQPPLSVVDLPLPGTKGAPKKFKGDFSEVDRFLHYYERLCKKFNVTRGDEKVENITQYCSRVVRETMEGLASYEGQDWDKFKADVRKLYEADKDSKRYRTRDLEDYIRQTRKRTKELNMESWIAYTRGFVRIGGWLKRQKKITQAEYDTYLWKGIPKAFRVRLEHRIMSQDPNHDLCTPFAVSSIYKAAETLLKRDRFDNDRMPSDSDDSDVSDATTDMDTDDEDSEEESNVRSVRKTARSAAKRPKSIKKKKVSFKNIPDDDEETEFELELSDEEESPPAPRKPSPRRQRTPPKIVKNPTPPPSAEESEIEDLIKQMGKLSLDDPAYAALYFRAVTRHPLVKDLVPGPSLTRRFSSTPPPLQNRFQRQPPPHMAGAASTRFEPRRCFGCGELGHNQFNCPELADLEKQGVIKRDQQGRVYLNNGDLVKRVDLNETIAQAVRRSANPTAHYVGIDDAWDWEADAPPAEEDATVTLYNYPEEFDSEEFPEVFPAERVTRSTNSARKERFDGVYVPSRRPALADAKENRRVGPPGSRQPPGIPSHPVPIEVRKPVFDPQDNDVIMEDRTNQPSKLTPAKPDEKAAEAPKGKATDDHDKDATRLARRSEVQAQVNPKIMLKKLLDTPITVGVGELLAVSREMSQQVQEVIKPKPQMRPEGRSTVRMVEVEDEDSPKRKTPTNIVATATFAPRTRGQLIRVRLECDGVPISAIIDTGSQLNIAHKRIWQQALTRPMDVTRRITMNDANGGEGLLHGFIPGVPLTCGAVTTYANVYVGNQAPFDLLLGRPWQRGNYVTIDERQDGTYLQFKDKEFNVRFEMLATPERDLEPIIADYVARTRAAASMFIQELPPTPYAVPYFSEPTELAEGSALGDIIQQALADLEGETASIQDLPDWLSADQESDDVNDVLAAIEKLDETPPKPPTPPQIEEEDHPPELEIRSETDTCTAKSTLQKPVWEEFRAFVREKERKESEIRLQEAKQ